MASDPVNSASRKPATAPAPQHVISINRISGFGLPRNTSFTVERV
jgi:hypothetical protein